MQVSHLHKVSVRPYLNSFVLKFELHFSENGRRLWSPGFFKAGGRYFKDRNCFNLTDLYSHSWRKCRSRNRDHIADSPDRCRPLTWVCMVRAVPSAAKSRSPSPQPTPRGPLEDSKPHGKCNPSRVFWVCPDVSSQLKTSPHGDIWEASWPDVQPTLACPSRSSGSTVSSSLMSEFWPVTFTSSFCHSSWQQVRAGASWTLRNSYKIWGRAEVTVVQPLCTLCKIESLIYCHCRTHSVTEVLTYSCDTAWDRWLSLQPQAVTFSTRLHLLAPAPKCTLPNVNSSKLIQPLWNLMIHVPPLWWYNWCHADCARKTRGWFHFVSATFLNCSCNPVFQDAHIMLLPVMQAETQTLTQLLD